MNVQVLELEKCAVQLEQCQLVRYNEKSGTMGKFFDEPKVRGRVVCVYVSVCVCVSVCVHVCMHVHVCWCACICVTCRIINSFFLPRQFANIN